MDAASAASQKKEFRTIAHSGGTVTITLSLDPFDRHILSRKTLLAWVAGSNLIVPAEFPSLTLGTAKAKISATHSAEKVKKRQIGRTCQTCQYRQIAQAFLCLFDVLVMFFEVNRD